jgi:hypothetical protein
VSLLRGLRVIKSNFNASFLRVKNSYHSILWRLTIKNKLLSSLRHFLDKKGVLTTFRETSARPTISTITFKNYPELSLHKTFLTSQLIQFISCTVTNTEEKVVIIR